MKRWTPWIIAVLVLGLLAAGALRTLSHRKQQQAELAAASARPTQATVELLPGDVAQAQLRRLPISLPISGSLRPTRSAMVKARVAGELRDLSVREGDTVRAGQVLARIDADEYQSRLRQAQQQADAARAQVDIAQRQFDNNKALVSQGFISATALQTSEANLNAARSTYQAALSAVEVTRKSLDDTVLKSPMDGQIAQRLAQPGERVGIDSRIVEVVDLKSLELEANLPAADALQARVGQQATLQIEGSAEPRAARIARISPSTQAGSRSVLTYLGLDNPAGLRSGMFARGQLQVGDTEGIAVPLDAVRTDSTADLLAGVWQGQDRRYQSGLARAVADGSGRIVAATSLVVGGGFAQMWVTIVGGQAFPLVIFPGRQVSSSFYDGVVNTYTPTLPEWLLGFSGIAIAGLIVMLAMKFLGFLPGRLDGADKHITQRAAAAA